MSLNDKVIYGNLMSMNIKYFIRCIDELDLEDFSHAEYDGGTCIELHYLGDDEDGNPYTSYETEERSSIAYMIMKKLAH